VKRSEHREHCGRTRGNRMTDTGAQRGLHDTPVGFHASAWAIGTRPAAMRDLERAVNEFPSDIRRRFLTIAALPWQMTATRNLGRAARRRSGSNTPLTKENSRPMMGQTPGDTR
jgi:hypothetical protein